MNSSENVGTPAPHHFQEVASHHRSELTAFLEALSLNGDEDFFHPHALNQAAVSDIITRSEQGPDEYWVLRNQGILAYGMLRGWAEGFDIPSLGVAVSPRHRGQGLARAIMEHLHKRACHRGASSVRLTVHRQNASALSLYRKFGYTLRPKSMTEYIGELFLTQIRQPIDQRARG